MMDCHSEDTKGKGQAPARARSPQPTPRNIEEAGDPNFMKNVYPPDDLDTPTQSPSKGRHEKVSPKKDKGKSKSPTAHFESMFSPRGPIVQAAVDPDSSSGLESTDGLEMKILPARSRSRTLTNNDEISPVGGGDGAKEWDPSGKGSQQTTPRATAKTQPFIPGNVPPFRLDDEHAERDDGTSAERALTQEELERSPKHQEIMRQWTNPASDKGKGVVSTEPQLVNSMSSQPGAARNEANAAANQGCRHRFCSCCYDCSDCLHFTRREED